MLRWLSVAPFGLPVVPDVYWMLIGSPGLRAAALARMVASGTPLAASMNASHSAVPRYTTRSSAAISGPTSSSMAR